MVEQIVAIIYRSIDGVGSMLPVGALGERDPDALLVGPDSQLDSLTTVNLLASIEADLEVAFGEAVSVIDVLFEDYRNVTVTGAAERLAHRLGSVPSTGKP